MEEFRTNIFEKTKEKSRRRLLYNLVIFGAIGGIWVIYGVFPFVGLKSAIGISVALLGFKLYDDKFMGISAYGDRKAELVIGKQYLEIRDIRIPYSDLNNLVIYVDEYLGMPREVFGIHHGGNNKIAFERNGKFVSINYVIKNKQDFQRVSRLVDEIENDPGLKKYLRKL